MVGYWGQRRHLQRAPGHGIHTPDGESLEKDGGKGVWVMEKPWLASGLGKLLYQTPRLTQSVAMME